MIDKRMLEWELRQARLALMEIQAAESDIQEMRDDMQRTHRAWQQLGLLGRASAYDQHERPALQAA